MAMHNVVLDPDGDILISVSRVLPSSSNEGTDSEQSESNGIEPDEKPQTDDKPETTEDQWHFRASTNSLCLASTYFRAMMSGPWREATHVYDDGLFHTSLDGFDPEAVSTTLSIIHGLDGRVPRTVSLCFLVDVAYIVDYLDCHQALQLYASLCIEHLAKFDWEPPWGLHSESPQDNWDRWITVAGVFQHSALFAKWTRIAAIKGLDRVPILNLPILSSAYRMF